jgi:hypothetical protein
MDSLVSNPSDVVGTTPATSFTLWYRESRRRPWRAVFTGPTTRDCTDHCAESTLRHGQWLTLETGKEP